MPDSLHTLRLRPLEDPDLDIIFEHEQDRDAQWMAAFVADDPADRAAFDAHWTRIRSKPDVVVRTVLVSDQVAGHVARFERDGDAEITYWIGREFWGRGVASAALAAFLEELAESPIHARVAADNPASIRVLEKNGFAVIARETGFANARQAEIEELVMVRR